MTVFQTVDDLREWVVKKFGNDKSSDTIDQITDAIVDHKYFPEFGQDASWFMDQISSVEDVWWA